MILIRHSENVLSISVNNLIQTENITLCRQYTSSFRFRNSRLLRENRTRSRPFIQTEDKKASMIAACTQTFHRDEQFPLWLNYHYKMGVGHFYIYDNAPFNETRLHHSLRPYIEADLVTIIPWYSNQWNDFKHPWTLTNWVAFQVWSQNDCIHRFGHLHAWLLMSDVDEYVLPMRRFRHFKQLLDSVPSRFCALQVLNNNFRGLTNQMSIAPEDRPSMFCLMNFKNDNPILLYERDFGRHECTER